MGFKRLDAEDFVVSADAVQGTAWSTDQPTLIEFDKSPTQLASTSGEYYLSVFQTASTDSSAEVQFDIAYGNRLGSGSTAYNPAFPALSPSATIYGQYRTMVLEDENSSFQYGEGNNLYTPNDFWVISVDRARYKEKLYPGTFNLTLSGSGGIEKLYLTDNSNDSQIQTFLGSTRILQIVSGSNGSAASGSGYSSGYGSYGLFLPELGTILLNPVAISSSIGVESNYAQTQTQNNTTLFDSIDLGSSFTLNSEETITSDYIFCRARNSEFNYSANPSFISGSTGEVVYDTFINNPQVYMTTVGMYNDANELVAVAKLSRPLLKDFTKESLIRVKLDF